MHQNPLTVLTIPGSEPHQEVLWHEPPKSHLKSLSSPYETLSKLCSSVRGAVAAECARSTMSHGFTSLFCFRLHNDTSDMVEGVGLAAVRV